MAKKMEMEGTLRVRIANPGERSVTYKAELILSDEDRFQLQQNLLTTELTLAVRTEEQSDLPMGKTDGEESRRAHEDREQGVAAEGSEAPGRNW